MADVGKNARTSYGGDGSTQSFAIGFPYLDETHIEVKVNAVVKVLNTDYTIDTDGTSLTFVVAPPAGSLNVVFTRITPHPALYVSFADGAAVTKQALDDAFTQGLYYTEEVEDQV